MRAPLTFSRSMRRGKRTCSACLKTAYATKALAHRERDRIAGGGGPRMRFYRGRCGWWHLTCGGRGRRR